MKIQRRIVLVMRFGQTTSERIEIVVIIIRNDASAVGTSEGGRRSKDVGHLYRSAIGRAEGRMEGTVLTAEERLSDGEIR